MLGLLKTHCVRLFSLSESTFVLLNNFKTAESSIFDTAHELGHIRSRLDQDQNATTLAKATAEAKLAASLA
jgi:Zn-dependent peptidase ImmA (M78 family)